MLKRYKFNGLEYQFEEGTQPAGAVAVDDKPKQPARKAARPRNKAAKVANKAASADE